MNLPNKTFCILPWVSIETSPIGTLRPCCLAEDELVDQKGNKYLIGDTPIQEVRDSRQMRQLRQEFLDGKKPDTCKKCWAVEESGGTSKREHTLDRLKHMGVSDDWSSESKPLMFIDFKLGNICNLKCRICGSWSSSSFATEEVQQFPTSMRKTSFPYKMIEQGRWPREKPTFWQEMSDNIDNILYLEFTGGEPFMIKEHFDFLQTLIDQDVAGDIEIHYNTNGTHYPKNASDIWKHFKLVEIAFSIDDVGDRFEYQRKNAEWDLVNANIQKFKELKQELGNIVLQCCSTVNVFNVFYLEELSEWIDKQEFDFVYWNMLHEIAYNNIANLPKRTKIKVTERLGLVNLDNPHKKEFDKIITFMNQGTDFNDGNDLLKSILKFDNMRNENLSDHHLELAKAIGYEKT